MTESLVDLAFTRALPKIELHAHLTGSITPQTLHEIWLKTRTSFAGKPLADPLDTLSLERSWDIKTFFPLFSSYIYSLLSTTETIIWSTNSVLYDFWADGVVYLELRTTPRASSTVSKEEYINIVLDCVETFEHRNQMCTYLILSIDRRNSAAQAIEVVDLALKFRGRGVVGIDLCGDPSKGNVTTFTTAFLKAKEMNLQITVHFAEIPSSSEEEELETLLRWRPDRLGHVICVREEMRREIQRQRLAVELCVSCNVQAGLTQGGVKGHHFGSWIGGDSPVILCVSDLSEPCPLAYPVKALLIQLLITETDRRRWHLWKQAEQRISHCCSKF